MVFITVTKFTQQLDKLYTSEWQPGILERSEWEQPYYSNLTGFYILNYTLLAGLIAIPIAIGVALLV